MGRKYKWREGLLFNDMESDTSESGYRVYHTPEGEATSVTTILSELPNPTIEAWRKRVGDEEANRISKEATDIGSFMHDTLECILKEQTPPGPSNELEEMAWKMSKPIKMLGLQNVTELWGVEEALHFGDVYAGRSDIIGQYKNTPSIMDFKTSKRRKPDEYLHHYKLQLSAYALAFEDMFGEPINQGVLFIAIRPNEYNKFSTLQLEVFEDLTEYKKEWVEVVVDFCERGGIIEEKVESLSRLCDLAKL